MSESFTAYRDRLLSRHENGVTNTLSRAGDVVMLGGVVAAVVTRRVGVGVIGVTSGAALAAAAHLFRPGTFTGGDHRDSASPRVRGARKAIASSALGANVLKSLSLSAVAGDAWPSGVSYVRVMLRSPRPAPGSCYGAYGIYRNARADGTIQVPPDVPNQTDPNFVISVLTG